jgi:hypothetical protein
LLSFGAESFVCHFSLQYIKIEIYRTIIFSVVLYSCKTWSLTLKEKRRLRVFENRALRRIFGLRRDEVSGEWGKPHNEKLSAPYSSPNTVWVTKSRMTKWAGHVARMRESRDV